VSAVRAVHARGLQKRLSDQSLAQKIAKVVLHLVTLAAVSVIREVRSGDDPELAEVNQRSDF